MKKTILIFGISSFVGSNLLELLKTEYRIIGTFYKNPVFIPGITCVPCDVLKKEYVSKLVAIFRPNISIYAAGLSSLEECKLFPKAADALNSAGAVNCCAASERYGSKFVFISSGFVLGGDDTIYREGETPFPSTVYGNSLSSTEFYVQRSCLNYLILRCSPLYGRGFNPKRSTWFEHVQAGFAKNEPVYADGAVTTGFLDVQVMAKILKAVLEQDVTNRLFHVSSRDYMTRYEFARLYARIFKKDESLIQKVSDVFPIDDKRHTGNKSQFFYRLDTSNLEEFLNTTMPTVEESLVLTHRRFNQILAG
jgi:dTDP-4-dehydrorhamnose reductase